MSLDTLLGQAALVTRWTYVEDSLGNKERSTSTQVAYMGRLEQTDARELQVGQATETSNYRLFLPSGAVVDAEDQITVDGQIFEVIGAPAIERSPRGPHHVVANLRLVV